MTAAEAPNHGFLVKNLHLVEWRDVGHGLVDAAIW